MTVEQTLANLVAIDSVSSRSNAEIISYLEKRCVALGFATQTLSHSDEHGVEKINLIARSTAISAGESQTKVNAAELALVGHTDTVPYDSSWREALKLTEQNDK